METQTAVLGNQRLNKPLQQTENTSFYDSRRKMSTN